MSETIYLPFSFRYHAGWADKIHGKVVPIGKKYNISTRLSTFYRMTLHNLYRW